MAATGRKNIYGFAGLITLVSDLKGLPIAPTEGPTGPSQTGTASASTPVAPRRSYGRGPLALGIAAVIALIVYANRDGGSSNTTSTRPTQTATAPARSPERVPAPDPQNISNNSFEETVPAPGTGNSLNVNEITYCLAQDARMTAVKPLIDVYSHTAIAGFNAVVADFNSRCSQYRYKETDMAQATAAVAARQVELKGQALEWLSTWQGSTKTKHRPPPPQPSIAQDPN